MDPEEDPPDPDITPDIPTTDNTEDRLRTDILQSRVNPPGRGPTRARPGSHRARPFLRPEVPPQL